MKRTALVIALTLVLSCFCAVSAAGGSYFTNPGEITLPTEAEGTGVLVGWSSGDLFLAPGAEYTAEEATTFEPVMIDIKTKAGAAVRTLSPAGLRFTTDIGEDGYQDLLASSASFEFGTLIAPLDHIDGEFTMEALDAAEKAYLSIPCKVFWGVTDTTRTYTGVIANILEKNYNRSFSAVAYLRVTYSDESERIFYGSYSQQENSRTVYAVSCDALADTNASYSEQSKAVLQNYFDKVGVDISLTVPVVGGTPDTAVANTANARYSVSTDWICQFSDMHDTFRNNYGYQATMTVTADAGITISENTVITYNGETPKANSYTVKDGVLIIIRRYCLGSYTWAY